MNKSDLIERKFKKIFKCDEWEIETDSGFHNIDFIVETIEYTIFEIKTIGNKTLRCADNHILFDECFNEKFCKDFKKGDFIITKDCIDVVDSVVNMNINETMYDVQLSDKSNHRYYTNDFLSHNTLIAKQLAKELFGSEDNMIRVDMSEYMEAYSISKLIGSAPGYVNHDDGGQITEKIKHKKFVVILWDEVEKAHPSVFNLLLQLFDEGHITDSKGTKIDCKNTINILTSNIGAKKSVEFGKSIGFTNNSSALEEEKKKNILEKELKKHFAPEFINRLDDIIYFNQLTDESLKEIIKLELNKFNKIINDSTGKYSLKYNDSVVNFILKQIEDHKAMGARPINRAIERHISTPLSLMVVGGDFKTGYCFNLIVNENKLDII